LQFHSQHHIQQDVVFPSKKIAFGFSSNANGRKNFAVIAAGIPALILLNLEKSVNKLLPVLIGVREQPIGSSTKHEKPLRHSFWATFGLATRTIGSSALQLQYNVGFAQK
jgi:hypothetical protein